MTTRNKQDKSFAPDSKKVEKSENKKKSFEQGLQNNTTDEEDVQSQQSKKQKSSKRAAPGIHNSDEPVEQRSDKLTP